MKNFATIAKLFSLLNAAYDSYYVHECYCVLQKFFVKILIEENLNRRKLDLRINPISIPNEDSYVKIWQLFSMKESKKTRLEMNKNYFIRGSSGSLGRWASPITQIFQRISESKEKQSVMTKLVVDTVLT